MRVTIAMSKALAAGELFYFCRELKGKFRWGSTSWRSDNARSIYRLQSSDFQLIKIVKKTSESSSYYAVKFDFNSCLEKDSVRKPVFCMYIAWFWSGWNENYMWRKLMIFSTQLSNLFFTYEDDEKFEYLVFRNLRSSESLIFFCFSCFSLKIICKDSNFEELLWTKVFKKIVYRPVIYLSS